MCQYDTIEEFLMGVTTIMADFFQSGCYTVHDSTMEELEQAVSMAEQYGMDYLSKHLQEFLEKIRMRRHQMKQEEDRLAETYLLVVEYLDLCRNRINYDRAEAYYKGEEQENL